MRSPSGRIRPATREADALDKAGRKLRDDLLKRVLSITVDINKPERSFVYMARSGTSE